MSKSKLVLGTALSVALAVGPALANPPISPRTTPAGAVIQVCAAAGDGVLGRCLKSARVL